MLVHLVLSIVLETLWATISELKEKENIVANDHIGTKNEPSLSDLHFITTNTEWV
jgi:hypothetical protein